MKILCALAGFAIGAAIGLAACGEAPGDANPDYLLIHPERLAELRTQCRMNPGMYREAVCRAAAEATRRRFMGEGVQHTPIAPASPLSDASEPGAAR